MLVGAIAIILVLISTDMVRSAIGVFPRLGEPVSDGPLVRATVYRTLDGVVGA